MLKILQAKLQQYVNYKLPDVQGGFRKGRGTRDQIANSHSFWLCGSQQTGKFLKRWEYQTIWPASWEICMQMKKQQLELDMEQQTSSKLGKEYIVTLLV